MTRLYFLRLRDLLEKLQLQRKELVLCGPHSQLLFALTRAGFLDRIGFENVCGDMEASLARARQILDQKKNKKIIDSKNTVANLFKSEP